jgi:hypothetical protein
MDMDVNQANVMMKDIERMNQDFEIKTNSSRDMASGIVKMERVISSQADSFESSSEGNIQFLLNSSYHISEA